MKLSKIAGCLFCSLALLLLAGCGASVSESIGGTVTGLSGGTTVVLVNNGVDPITVSASGNFTFGTEVSAGSSYNVTVQDNPTGETCTVSNGSGTVSSSIGAVTNVTVACSAILTNYNSVTGTVSGLGTGASVTLLDNGTSGSTVTTGNGSFTFPTQLLVGSTYTVTVATTPTGVTCTVANASGGVPSVGDTTSVVVTCT
ncbi:MAG TPA: hypothetical protein VK832_16610 [Burkholderiaceae bacterium]|jgi:hypothetical protein|nr:hypothetical protein [Burkholderiaceae bacterium]